MAVPDIKKIGKYDVTDVLGQGGMGIVYAGVDSKIQRKVAIKMMTGGYAENPDLLKRFYREAQASGMLQHRNIVTVYDLGDEAGNPYMVMEYITGESLEDIIAKRRRMSLVEKLDIMIQICAGLQYAHAHGIVHRDIKPANIMVLQDNSIKIVDFGIARVSDNSMTKTGQIVGTINYMSPEQFNGHVVDGRTDVFSAGVLFYEFLTGVLPFDGAETPSVILKILNEPPPPLKEHIQDFPPQMEVIVNKALAKDREERYSSADDFSFDLQHLQEGLKKNMVVEYVEQARAAVTKNEFNKAKDLLQQVLKADTQHVAAKEMMQEVQKHLQLQQRGEQLRQLRAAAEEALANKQIEEAVSLTEQALKLDKTNPELVQLHQMATQAKARKDQVVRTVRKAEALKAEGELEAALKIAEEALALDPKDQQALGVRDAIQAEIKKKSEQQELVELQDSARKAISDRQFTKAMAMVRRAEMIQSGGTQVGSLRNVANSARENEVRRVAVVRALSEIELCLHKEGSAHAATKVVEALKKFPGEHALVELQEQIKEIVSYTGLGDAKKVSERAKKLTTNGAYEAIVAMADRAMKAGPADVLKQMHEEAEAKLAETKKKATTATQEAKKLLSNGKVDDAVALLESQPLGAELVDEFFTILEKARAEQDKLASIEVAILETRGMLMKGDFAAATDKTKALMKANPGSVELQKFYKELESTKVSKSKENVEKAIKEAKALLLARQIPAATKKLQDVSPLVSSATPELQQQYQTLLKEVGAAGAAGSNLSAADMSKTIVHGSAGTAQAGGASHGTVSVDRPAAQKTMVHTLPVKAFPVKKVAIPALAVVLLVGGFFGYRALTKPPDLDTYVEINATPYASVKNIVSTNGKLTYEVNQDTPVRVALSTGEFTVNLTGPDGKAQTCKITVSKTSPGQCSPAFVAVNPDDIVNSSK